jgi:hypothetical protein
MLSLINSDIVPISDVKYIHFFELYSSFFGTLLIIFFKQIMSFVFFLNANNLFDNANNIHYNS